MDVNQSKIYKDSKRPKKWMNTLIDHSEILSDHPTQSFVHRFLNDSNTRGIQNDLETLKIAPHSWFWDDLIKSSIHSIKKMNEAEFFKFIPRFLGLVEQNALYTTSILIALLERYAKTSHREKVHEVLKNLALNQWGNPQYDSSAGWNNVNAKTKRMVIQWFVRADLEAFFKLFSRTADVNRFNYWIKFIDKISFSQIFLGPMAVQSAQSQHKKFRESNRGRLKELIGSTSSNNAFLLKIDNVFVVDFSDTGNACYIVKKLPYKEQDKKVHIDELKPWPNILKLNHIAGWEHRFDEKLAEIGIFSNILKTNSYSSGYKR